MPAHAQTRLLHQFCTLVATRATGEVPDRELLDRFSRQRDEAAFEALLRRHGPMVWRLCRRVLRHEQDAEDAFQATFVILARKAASLRRQEAVGAWLYGVAHRVALKARVRVTRRRQLEGQAPERPPIDPLDEISVREAQTVLDEELLRLPARYQAPVLLCCLEGLTRDEAAARVGVSVSTLKSRLEEGRRRLRDRLARRGLALSAVLASALLAAPVSAGLPPRLLATALQAALSAPFSAAQAALAFVAGARLKLGALLVVIAGLVAGGLALDPSTAGTDQPAAPQPPPQQAAAQEKAKVDRLGDPLPPGALMRLGTLRNQFAWRAQFLADGKTFVGIRGDKLHWTDAASGVSRRSWPLPAGHTFLCASADGRQVVLSANGSLSLWDAALGQWLRELAEGGVGPRGRQPTAAQFAPDGRSIVGFAYAPFRAEVYLWNVADGKLLWREEVQRVDHFRDSKRPGGSPFLEFLPDGETLALLDGPAHRLELRGRADGKRGTLSPALAVQADYQWAVAPDGKTFLAVSPRDGLRQWVPGEDRGWHQRDSVAQEKPSRLAFSGDGKTLLLAGAGKLSARDWPSCRLRREIDLGGREVQALYPARDGRRAYLLFTYETTLRHIDLVSGKETTPGRQGHRGIVSAFALAPDGKAVSAGYDGSVQVWDLASGRATGTFRPKNGCIFAALSGDGKLLAAVDWERTEVALHDRDTGRLVRTIQTDKPVRHLAFAPKSRLLLTGEEIPARVFRVWDADTGKEVRRLEGELFARPAFSPDGRLLAALGEKQLRLIEFPSGKEVGKLPVAGRYGLTFSPNGRTLACGDWKVITLWEVATRTQRSRIEVGGDCTALRFAPDGRWLAWGEGEQVRLWDLGRNRLRHTFRGHAGNVTDLRFTPDGGRLISASTDSTLLVWDLTALRGE